MNIRRGILPLVLAAAVTAGCGGCGVVRSPADPAEVTAPTVLPASVTFGVTAAPSVTPSAAPPPAPVGFAAGCQGKAVASFPKLGSAPVPSTSLLQSIKNQGFLTVGISEYNDLLARRDPVTGAMSGFEVDLVDYIAGRMFPGGNLKTTIHWVSTEPADWRTDLTDTPKNTSTEIDLVLGDMTMTCPRWDDWDFSTEYLDTKQKLLVRKGSGFKGLNDPSGGKVCSPKGSTNIGTLEKGYPKLTDVSAASDTDCMLLLQQGEVDAVFTDDVILAGLAAQDSTTELIAADPKLDHEPAAIGIRPDPERNHDLTRYVNGVLADYRGDGLHDRSQTPWEISFQKYLQPQLDNESPPAPDYRP